MKQFSTIVTIVAGFLFCGMNCHNKTIEKTPPLCVDTSSVTWGELWANKFKIDRALHLAFQDVDSLAAGPRPRTIKKSKRRTGRLEIESPGASDSNIFIIKQDALNYE